MILKREFAINEYATRSNEDKGDRNEENGGDPAENEAGDREETKDFTLRTVYEDENFIKGWLYKAAQKMSLMQKDFFFRRYFVLDK